MATKWKNRLIAVIWVLLMTYGVSGILLFVDHSNEWMKNYYQSSRFQRLFNQYETYLSLYKLDPVTEEQAKAIARNSVTDNEIKSYIKNQLVPSGAAIGKPATIKLNLVNQKLQKIDQFYRQKQTQRPNFKRLESSFQYYLKDTDTGKVYTDLHLNKGATPEKVSRKMTFVQKYPSSGDYFTTGSQYDFFGEIPEAVQTHESFSGFIGVPSPLQANSLIRSDYQDFHRMQVHFYAYAISGLVALMISLFMLKKLPVLAFAENESWLSFYRRVPLDFCLGVAFVTFLIAFYSVTETGTSFTYSGGPNISLWITAAIAVALLAIQVKGLRKRLKMKENLKEEWDRSLILRGLNGLRDAFLDGGMGLQMLALLIVMFASGFGLTVVLIRHAAITIYAPLFIIVTIPTLIMAAARVGAFNRILSHTSSLARGNVEPDLQIKGRSQFAVLADNINVLKEGVESSQAEKAKSERLKTELITNVSHDLRTPLTSIITYSELLKTPDLSEDERAAYLEIIDRKSKRLKGLIEDLFEASKMASGSIELVKEKVDMVQLLEQALAENDERIENSSLEFRVKKPEPPLYCVVDGQKIWRVFDNLIGNILKYAMDKTRVYITLEALRGQVRITFKNISQYELDESAEELFERFKRGDTSRHTEGSGLGLAIAKSISDLHGGSLEIEVDGDLFKVTVTLEAAD